MCGLTDNGMSAEFKVEYTAFQDNGQRDSSSRGPEKFMVTEKTTFGQFCNAILERFVSADLEKDIIDKTSKAGTTSNTKYVIRICSTITDKEFIVISSITGTPGLSELSLRWKLRPCHPDLSIFLEVPHHFNVFAGYEAAAVARKQ